jgi:hypothetical protein
MQGCSSSTLAPTVWLNMLSGLLRLLQRRQLYGKKTRRKYSVMNNTLNRILYNRLHIQKLDYSD